MWDMRREELVEWSFHYWDSLRTVLLRGGGMGGISVYFLFVNLEITW